MGAVRVPAEVPSRLAPGDAAIRTAPAEHSVALRSTPSPPAFPGQIQHHDERHRTPAGETAGAGIAPPSSGGAGCVTHAVTAGRQDLRSVIREQAGFDATAPPISAHRPA